MTEQNSFNIQVHGMFYIIKPQINLEHTLYEVYTKCEKLFTLKKNNEGSWVTEEDDLYPISENLYKDIGGELEQLELQLNDFSKGLQ